MMTYSKPAALANVHTIPHTIRMRVSSELLLLPHADAFLRPVVWNATWRMSSVVGQTGVDLPRRQYRSVVWFCLWLWWLVLTRTWLRVWLVVSYQEWLSFPRQGNFFVLMKADWRWCSVASLQTCRPSSPPGWRKRSTRPPLELSAFPTHLTRLPPHTVSSRSCWTPHLCRLLFKVTAPSPRPRPSCWT